MNFRIANQPYIFTLLVNQQGELTDFTAVNEESEKEYDCSIQLTSQELEPELICCTPVTCTGGPCRGASQTIQAQGA
jgi:hypothetical protein